jgi:hypothetical protein
MMIRKLDVLATAVVLLLGVAHTAFTPVFAPGFSVAALWFSGAGLSLVFLGLLNAARLAAPVRPVRRICVIGNVLALAWIAFVLYVIRVPQAYISAVAVMTLAVTSVARTREACKQSTA